MASLYRREYKRKSEDAALEDASQVINDLEHWKDYIPEIIDKIRSSRLELRISALRSLNELISGQHIAYEEIEEYVSDLFCSTKDVISEYLDISEHDEALAALCNISLNCFSDFEGYSIVFLNDLIPLLPMVLDSERFKFYALAFIVSFSIHSQQPCIDIMSRYIRLLVDKKARSNKFSNETVSEIIRGLTLMISVFPESVPAVILREELKEAMDKLFESHDYEVLFCTLELLSAVYESINEYEPEDDEEFINVKVFSAHYKGKILDIHNSVTKKSEQKDLRNKAMSVVSLFDGENIEEEITLIHQTKKINGARRIIIASAIRRICKHKYQQQMAENPGIHTTLGFDLMTKNEALRLKKRYKNEIERTRIINTREREQSITKKREMKYNPKDED